ncbi:hypothetical protein ENBRE01_2890 [Enteropsectra breve]|nr:hypothetical protein ENBRE01_2890 [Enteropsectra breve]
MYSPTAEEVTHVLEACEICQLQLRLRTRSQNRVIYATKPGIRYQADLIDLRHYADENRGYCWILNIVDVYSKFLISIPPKSKSAVSVLAGFKKAFHLYGEPQIVQTDNGTEFKNSTVKHYFLSLNVQQILEGHGIHRRKAR